MSGPDFPRLLVLDSSSERVALALVAGARVHAQLAAGGPVASSTLIPAIAALLAEAGIALDQLDAIAFCAGPGSFTGVRTATAVAQGLAVARDLPLIALDALEVLAYEAAGRGAGDFIVAVIDARMGEVYYAAWRRAGNELEAVLEPAVAAPARACAELAALFPAERSAVVGAPELLAAAGWQAGTALPCALEPQALARRARALHARGAGVRAADAQPTYVRNKVALTTREREARAAAQGAAELAE